MDAAQGRGHLPKRMIEQIRHETCLISCFGKHGARSATTTFHALEKQLTEFAARERLCLVGSGQRLIDGSRRANSSSVNQPQRSKLPVLEGATRVALRAAEALSV